MADTIAIARQQTIFAMKETTAGTLVFPESDGSSTLMVACGEGQISQNPSFTNSDEIKNSRDVIDRFVDKRPAGAWSFPVYVRPSGTAGTAPQEDVLLECLQGTKSATSLAVGADTFTGSGLDDFTAGGTYSGTSDTDFVVEIDGAAATDTFKWSNDGGSTWEAETVAMTGAAQTLENGVTVTFTATTGHTSGDSWAFTATIAKVEYSQALTKPSFSLWMMKGHTLWFAKGCTVADMKLSGETKGSPKYEFSGGLMWMGWEGEDTLTGAEAAAQTVIGVDNPKRHSVGARIWNYTDNDDNSGAGYAITDVDVDTSEITISPAVPAGSGWTSGATIKPFLPAGTDVGEPTLAKDASVDIGSDTGKAVKSYNLTVNDPVTYPEEISGDTYPTSYMEDVRNIKFDFTMFLRQSEVAFFYDGYNDTEVAVDINLGTGAGSIIELAMGYVSLDVPTAKTEAPAIAMDISGLALGSAGEDSLVITYT